MQSKQMAHTGWQRHLFAQNFFVMPEMIRPGVYHNTATRVWQFDNYFKID